MNRSSKSPFFHPSLLARDVSERRSQADDQIQESRFLMGPKMASAIRKHREPTNHPLVFEWTVMGDRIQQVIMNRRANYDN